MQAGKQASKPASKQRLKKKKQLTDMNYAGLCVAFAYLASALVGNTMYYTAPFLFIALGMGYVKNREMNAAREI